MANLYLLNGSNIGNRLQNLKVAIEYLSELWGSPKSVSDIYETQAWGKENQQNFYNQALHFTCDYQPDEILKAVKKIEQKIGRNHQERWAARTIDIDIIFYDDLIYQSDHLHIPHKLMHLRNFVLYPLCEIADDFIHPQFEQSVQLLLENSTDELKVQKLSAVNEI